MPLKQLEEIVAWARERDLPVHVHAAEQVGELKACQREYGATPVELLAQRGIYYRLYQLQYKEQELHLSVDVSAGPEPSPLQAND